ncbi:TetR/AcrR family transcriptional regulator [Nocardia panacis]|uniref:TetR/AcrR family transcriptional regulator n=1 Tax=Nocardia panacis TaxID=2340916 RepID=A0A3A4KI40_9NOCA|nr:TetR/AcrR family transcriptional regulator [Nocardia panacis]RJO73353.1 TetR/AcrR family transcriptional regulator [Nocardia panacis]
MTEHTPSNSDPTTDGRRQRGARSRQIITRHAVDVASLDGLGGLSFGRLAEDLDISKAGIQTLFGTKQRLQLSTVETARMVFIDAVIRPAEEASEGVPLVRALLEHWITYVAKPLFPGGCFWNANLAEFDSHPGPVRDALMRQRRDWLNLLAGQLERAALPETDLTVFQLDAALNATNTALRLGESDGVEKLRRVIDGLLPESIP